MLHRFVAVLSAFAVLITAQASAKNFTTADVENFIKVSEELKGLEDRYPDADLGVDTSDMKSFTQMIDENGNLKVYRRVLSDMPEGPARKEVVSAIKSNGFSSTDEFAPKADAIIMTYLAIELGKQDMSGMDQMTPEMMAAMPPSVQAQMGPVIKMINAAKNVPAADKATLTPLLPKLEAVFQD
ncbi:hypothetical protein [Parvularcula marina]|uniref:DUF2059 domain-containing protein n=1 Tax=Parvularcula marina TaxID=2292771 RepID=A0A371RIK4_9PROT|nr:hypothetical protein [Parvularcula marina]RFB05284.1 hypothetical protein DX908_08460 [Parvularcula marina]